MQTTGKLFDDLARMASGAAGTLSGIREEIEQMVKLRLERMLADMELVRREEFEAVKEMAVKARTEQEALGRRIGDLESRLAASGPKSAAAESGSKAAARKTPRKAARKSATKSSGGTGGVSRGKSPGKNSSAGDSQT